MTKSDPLTKSLSSSILSIAVPISLQSLFQASLSVIDQIMVGQLGTDSITSIGLGSKFPFLFTITLAAIGTASSIMISQYCGGNDKHGVNDSHVSNSLLALIVTAVFFLPSVLMPRHIMELYTADTTVIGMASEYLRITAIGYIPLLCTTMLSALLRNTGNARSPMVAGIIAVSVNTSLNFVLIFGNFGAPKLGVNGAAIATTTARFIECLILLVLFCKTQNKSEYKIHFYCIVPNGFMKQTLVIACPIVINEFLWGFGDTMYAVIYGHIGTGAMAAMTLTYPIQSLSIGLFTGASTAAAIIVGNYLGKGENNFAFKLSRKFVKFGIIGSIGLGLILCLLSNFYSDLFNVSSSTKHTTVLILYIFAAVLFVKVSNMILSGGILRSGGKTKYTLLLDVFGTWGIGIPLGFLSAFVWHLPIQLVYFLISTEEIVRLILGIKLFITKKWMSKITTATI